MKRHRWHIIQDFIVIAISFGLAIYAWQTGLVDSLVNTFTNAFGNIGNTAIGAGQLSNSAEITLAQIMPYIGIFIAGMFFTSAFTTAPAIVILGEFSKHNNLMAVALIGGLGAAIGDFILFKFVKDRVADDFKYLFHMRKKGEHAGFGNTGKGISSRKEVGRSFKNRLTSIFHTKLFHWFAPFIGALIIASPLPDELGIAILGLSRMKDSVFIPVSFVFNAIGIFVIGWAVHAVL